MRSPVFTKDTVAAFIGITTPAYLLTDIYCNCGSCYAFHFSGQIKEAIFLLLEGSVDTLVPSAASLLLPYSLCAYILYCCPPSSIYYSRKCQLLKMKWYIFMEGRAAHIKDIFKQTRSLEIVS